MWLESHIGSTEGRKQAVEKMESVEEKGLRGKSGHASG